MRLSNRFSGLTTHILKIDDQRLANKVRPRPPNFEKKVQQRLGVSPLTRGNVALPRRTIETESGAVAPLSPLPRPWGFSCVFRRPQTASLSVAVRVLAYRALTCREADRSVRTNTATRQSGMLAMAARQCQDSQRTDCVAGVVDGVSGLVAAVSGPLGGCASD
jgi:hypothetical protein